MVLRNIVTLLNDQPAVMHFVADAITARDITDPDTGRSKRINVLEFQLDELNGSPTNAVWSVTSEKLAMQLEPFRQNKRYLTLNVIVTKRGSGFRTEYEVMTQPRASV